LLENIQTIHMIRHDRSVTDAQVKGQPVVAIGRDGAAADILRAWNAVSEALAAEDGEHQAVLGRNT